MSRDALAPELAMETAAAATWLLVRSPLEYWTWAHKYASARSGSSLAGSSMVRVLDEGSKVTLSCLLTVMRQHHGWSWWGVAAEVEVGLNIQGRSGCRNVTAGNTVVSTPLASSVGKTEAISVEAMPVMSPGPRTASGTVT
jgi:hypothetical protein